MELPHLKSLLLQFAPELTDAPLYVVQHPSHLPAPRDAGAFAMRSIDCVWRKHFIEQGEWQGQGRLISYIDIEQQDMLAIGLHEAAHVLPAFEVPEDEEPTTNEYAERFELLEREATERTDCKLAEFFDKWFPCHDINWIRICTHLWWRAALAGHVVSQNAMCVAGYRYDLTNFDSYFAALGTEPQRMLGATFQDIVCTEAPAAFTELWKSDLASNAERMRKRKLNHERREGTAWLPAQA